MTRKVRSLMHVRRCGYPRVQFNWLCELISLRCTFLALTILDKVGRLQSYPKLSKNAGYPPLNVPFSFPIVALLFVSESTILAI
jgi:hypothetical protein